MPINEILNSTNHRPWELPNSTWKYYQEWSDVLFLHFQVDLDDLSKWVPSELEIDLFENQAWVSVVVFRLERIRPRGLPSFPPISNFDEVNIRTYVRSGKKTGVYFLSIEVGQKLSQRIAKAISKLPYRYSPIQKSQTSIIAQNHINHDYLEATYSLGQKIEDKSDLDVWLTERYALFQDAGSDLNEFEIHHIEWPITQVKLTNFKFNYPKFNTLLKSSPDKVHFSEGLAVIAWGKTKIAKLKG